MKCDLKLALAINFNIKGMFPYTHGKWKYEQNVSRVLYIYIQCIKRLYTVYPSTSIRYRAFSVLKIYYCKEQKDSQNSNYTKATISVHCMQMKSWWKIVLYPLSLQSSNAKHTFKRFQLFSSMFVVHWIVTQWSVKGDKKKKKYL